VHLVRTVVGGLYLKEGRGLWLSWDDAYLFEGREGWLKEVLYQYDLNRILIVLGRRRKMSVVRVGKLILIVVVEEELVQ
jgi:hypothetical protein